MFQKARLRLTGWYLLILTMIVVLFSVTIYRLVDVEITRVAMAQRSRMERWQVIIPPGANIPNIVYFDEEEVIALRQRLLMMLSTVDTIIIVVVGGLSYLLAGKTLTPIQEIVEKQEQFVADSSHELRTPLTALRTSMEVALRDKKMTTSIAASVIQENLTEVIRLQNLAENLLELTRSGKKLKLEKVELAGIVEAAYQQVKKVAEQKEITISLPKTHMRVRANKMALERVMVIILDNAIKYSPAKSVVKLLVKDNRRNGVITVSDHGKGIAPAQVLHVFERFYRGDVARSNEIPGYGLGLAIARELVTAQNGTIAIESKEGVFTKVHITLPLSA